MSLPAALSAQILALQTAYKAALPIERAQPLIYADLDNKAWALIAAVDAQVATVGTALDGFDYGKCAPEMADALIAAAQNANDALDAYEARSYIGRFTANLELIEGYGRYFATAQPLEIRSTARGVLNFQSPEQSGLLVAI